MHLKSIEMVGFKSFADKTFIELKEGLSEIVGPNGCGKSNIVDALRWCLGEMSAKSLRSKQMVDVIFAGAAGRSPVNLSEVTLTFDNSHHLLPTDYSEVQVTRRLYRSGESEYYLNKTQCRLKDIRELFLDTGLGEGYSILAQGEVDFVMNAKPEQRRELFEEAAGISKYKVRREETLHKLEKVEMDLSRLNDIIALIKEQMDSLESAARKAKLFQKLREELKSLEIADSLNSLTDLEEKINTAQKRMNELQTEMQQATVELDCAETQLTQNRLKQDEYEKQIHDAELSNMELEKKINAGDLALQNAREREQSSIQQEKKSLERIHFHQEESMQLEKKLNESQLEIKALDEQFKKIKESFDKEKEEWENIEKKRKELETVKNSSAESLFQIAGEIAGLHNEKISGSSSLIHKQSESASLEKELSKSQEEQTRLSNEIEIMNSQLHDLKTSHCAIENEVTTLRENLLCEEKKQNELLHKLESARHKIIRKEAHLSSIIQSFENHPYRKGTQAILRQGFPGLKGVVGLLLKYPNTMAHWVETALGHRINFLVFEHLHEAKEALDWLKENKLGRATCIVLEKIPTVNQLDLSSIPNANSILSFVHCSEELENLRKYLLGSAFLTGNTLFDTGTIDGGSDFFTRNSENTETSDKDKNEDARSENQFQVKEKLEQEIHLAKQDLDTIEKEHSEHQTEINRIETTLAEKEMVLGKIHLQENHLEEILAAKKEETEVCKKEFAFIAERCKQDRKEIAELSGKIEQLQEKIEQLTATQKQKEQEREELQKKIEQKQSQEHRSELAARESEIRLESFQTHLDKNSQSAEESKRRMEQCHKAIADTQIEIENARQVIEKSQKMQKDESVKIVKLQEEKTQLSARIEEFLKGNLDWVQKNQACESALQEIRKKQNQLGEILHQVELDLRTYENEKKNIIGRLQEIYQINLQEAQQQVSTKPVDPEEIQKLKKRIESMSNSVNLEAPEQHQHLQERYQFLTTQTEDLTKAREDLKNAIHQINTTTRDQFKETFAKVRENFRTVYSKLFSGGVADLIFTDEQNLLETGIDIVAQPPGKKLQNIALLSGGEKALTAIALLFAFFMVKPSPFCVLDEVDAPWDPANVTRFLNLLKDFSQKTQFLIVTHNPRTMEMSDILYGVTMQEAGVSKIFSMKLHKESSQRSAVLEPVSAN